MYFNIKINILD